MKLRLLSCLLVLLLGLPVLAAPPQGRSAQNATLTVDNTPFIAANRIGMFVTNHGNFGRDLAGVFGNDYGTYFPFTSAQDINDGKTMSPYYAGGLWVGGIDQASGDTLVVVSEYSSEYVPGPALAGTFQTDRPAFKVYKLYKDSLADNPNADYTNWPVDQGAPTRMDTTWDADSNIVSVDEVPDMIGDQMFWTVFNDLDPEQHDNNNGETDPLGLEIKQTVFAFERTNGALANIIFIRYRVYNVGTKTLNNCFFSLWSDPDLGTAGDDLVGCDTLLDLAYTYNSINIDPLYSQALPPIVPSVGLDFFQGPLIPGAETDTAKMWGLKWPGYQNMGLYSFNKYINGTDPDNFSETYAFMQGLQAKEPGYPPYVYEGQELKFVYTGDPVTNTGDLDFAPDDRRHMQTTGPITFAPGDSTEILAAMVVGQGGDRLSSITVMKGIDAFAQKLYELDFQPPEPCAKPVVTVAELPGEISLYWGDTSEVDPGDYEFEGYTVWQGASASGPWTQIATYDLVNDRKGGLVDTVFVPEAGQPLPVSMRGLNNAGLDYSYTFTSDMLTGSDLYNASTYYFKISAFTWGVNFKGSPVSAGDHFLESETIVSAIPQEMPAGWEPQMESQSDLVVTHVGPSQGAVTVQIIDPTILTGHDYSVTFGTYPDTIITPDGTEYWDVVTLNDTCDWLFHEDTTALGADTTWWEALLCLDSTLDSVSTVVDTTVEIRNYWDLNDLTAGTTVLSRMLNQSNDDDYFVTDGFLCKVSGAEAGILSFELVANGAGDVDPPEAAAAEWYDFPVPPGPAGDYRPTSNQQVGDGLWLIHTGDNGGTNGGGERYTYETFLTRTFRSQDWWDRLGAWDWEMRFTGENSNPGVNGSWAWDAFNFGYASWVPFELWRAGIATPDDPSDDVRCIPWVLGDAYGDGTGDNLVFDMSQWGSDLGGTCHDGCEHSVSGGDNDPYTDWVYWAIPGDDSPGDAAYQTFATAMQTDPENWDGDEVRVFDRLVLVNWNGDTTADASGGATVPSGYNQDLPEMGSVFRIVTAKPNSSLDTFSFSTAAAAYAANEAALDNIKAVPNPFYLSGPYDPAVGNYKLQFNHLPEVCTITIYNLAGDYITRIEKDDAGPLASWNLQTDNRIPVASGIYIYVVDAPGFGQKIGKVAVFYEDEVLQNY